MSDFKEVKYQPRQDWNQTSTGVGHHYRPGYYFPSSHFHPSIGEPVPPPLAHQDQVTRDQHFETTTGKAHDRKYPATLYSNPVHQKAPGHWKVDYVKDLAEKLSKGGWRRPLTMGNQTSETREKFCSEPGVRQKYHFDDTAGLGLPQNFNLHDHHVEGPSKLGQATTQNPKLQGKQFYVRDRGVLNLLDPYLTTTHKDHRAFKPDELKKYPKKDAATYWQCEDYPKAWGHGLKANPLPKTSVPREQLPMRDTTFFTTKTKVPRPPKAMVPVPHSGLKSEHADRYTRPNDVRFKEAIYCPVDPPFTLPVPGTKSAMTAPKMYNTEYQHVGSEKPIMV
ncbi:stabilizer of axonemal microtubules 3-like [Ruditapes philippinarum]|uniref:stabilizer of axonemal microtubules 3-like n=1 Tax=Ruditapes philippinarum TaxID=129788 RepID=UPI00295B340E|nr:stabilizer of axonemal microtubules 3-like [Ruditapes philippinarum]